MVTRVGLERWLSWHGSPCAAWPPHPASRTCFWDLLGHMFHLGGQERPLRPYGVAGGSFPPLTRLAWVLRLSNHKSPPYLPAPLLLWTETRVTQVD